MSAITQTHRKIWSAKRRRSKIWRMEWSVFGKIYQTIAEICGGDDALSKELFAAAQYCKRDEAKRLIEQGADVNYRTRQYGFCHQTPLHITRDLEIVRMLLEHHADVNACDDFLQTPLHCLHSVEKASALISGGAEVDAKDKDGNTPLHLACLGYQDESELMRLLLDHAADINALNNQGETPLDVYFSNQHQMLPPESAPAYEVLSSRGAVTKKSTVKVVKQDDSEAIRQESDFKRRQEQAPIKDILGLVDAAGPSGWNGDREGSRILAFQCDGWRFADSPLREEPLHFEMEISEQELAGYMKSVKPYHIVLFQAQVAQRHKRGMWAKAKTILSLSCDDPGLSARSVELQKPVCIHDDALGEFVLDRSINWFTGNPLWNGSKIRLHLETESEQDPTRSLQVAKELWKSQTSWHQKILDYAAAEMLPLKNESWRNPWEFRFSARRFKSRMTLESITVSSNGNFEFWFEDGGLFYGHSIVVKGNLNSGLKEASIQG